VIDYRVTTLTRRADGTDWATIHTGFPSRAAAGAFAEECRSEDPHAAVDVIAVGERGEVVPDRSPERPAKTAGARDALQRATLALPERRDL